MEPHLPAEFGTLDPERVADDRRRLREEHYRCVTAELPAGRLLVFDIEPGPPERMCEAIRVPSADAARSRLENPSLNWFGRALSAHAQGDFERFDQVVQVKRRLRAPRADTAGEPRE